jgi:hypothetical protein
MAGKLGIKRFRCDMPLNCRGIIARSSTYNNHIAATKETFVKKFATLIVLFVIGFILIVTSGELPENVNLSLQAGLTVFTSAAFLFFERMITGGWGDDDELRDLRRAVEELTEEVRRLNQD